mgnify:CR=1 FL=1
MKFPFLIMTKEYQFPPITNIIQKLFFPWKYIRRGTLVVSNRQFHFFRSFNLNLGISTPLGYFLRE